MCCVYIYIHTLHVTLCATKQKAEEQNQIAEKKKNSDMGLSVNFVNV